MLKFWKRDDDPLSGFSDDEVQAAALRVFVERPSTGGSWIGGTVEQCDRAIAECERLREKYAGYEPLRMRKAIMGWIDFFDREARENRRDCETQKSKRELDAYREENNLSSSRTQEILEKIRKADPQ